MNYENCGEMAEWFKAHAWKACERATVPRVRISLSPPINGHRYLYYALFIHQILRVYNKGQIRYNQC